MGVIAQIMNLVSSAVKKKGNNPGNSVVAKAEGFPGQVLTPEIFHSPGTYGIPGDGTKGIRIPISGTSKYGIVITTNNYNVQIDVGGQGGMAIYSTNSAGDTVMFKIVLDPDGNIALNGDSKSLVTHKELDTALQLLVAAINANFALKLDGGGTAGTSSIDISASATTTVKTSG